MKKEQYVWLKIATFANSEQQPKFMTLEGVKEFWPSTKDGSTGRHQKPRNIDIIAYTGESPLNKASTSIG